MSKARIEALSDATRIEEIIVRCECRQDCGVLAYVVQAPQT
jgi:hypothetical protein